MPFGFERPPSREQRSMPQVNETAAFDNASVVPAVGISDRALLSVFQHMCPSSEMRTPKMCLVPSKSYCMPQESIAFKLIRGSSRTLLFKSTRTS